jgi:hypothetical protein
VAGGNCKQICIKDGNKCVKLSIFVYQVFNLFSLVFIMSDDVFCCFGYVLLYVYCIGYVLLYVCVLLYCVYFYCIMYVLFYVCVLLYCVVLLYNFALSFLSVLG